MSVQPALSTLVHQLRTGRVKPLGAAGLRSAIHKELRHDPIYLGPDGLEGDEQADRNFHGGPEKAVLHYALGNYDAWLRDGGDAASFQPGAFGENILSRDLDETNVCLGDVFEIGSAVVQVSQPRQPCFKLNHRFQSPGMARRVQETGRTGWYYRVITPGTIVAGNGIRLVARRHSEWPLRRVQHHLYVDRMNETALAELVAIPELSEPMRKILAMRLRTSAPESWDARLIGTNTTTV
jgi:MOSC domain-containing protein YiiM